MAFMCRQYDRGQTAPIEYQRGKDGVEYTVGLALTVTGGEVVPCGGAVRPSYICVGGATVSGLVPCNRVAADIVYTAPLSVGGSALKVGDKVTLGADGLTVTATTAGGVAEIVGMDGTAEGDFVDVRF